jgi:hypothetical protein
LFCSGLLSVVSRPDQTRPNQARPDLIRSWRIGGVGRRSESPRFFFFSSLASPISTGKLTNHLPRSKAYLLVGAHQVIDNGQRTEYRGEQAGRVWRRKRWARSSYFLNFLKLPRALVPRALGPLRNSTENVHVRPAGQVPTE